MLDLLKKVNAEIPLFLSDNHGFPMSFLAGIPCLSERPRFGFSLHYWSQRSRTLIFQPRNLKRFTFRTFKSPKPVGRTFCGEFLSDETCECSTGSRQCLGCVCLESIGGFPVGLNSVKIVRLLVGSCAVILGFNLENCNFTFLTV